MFSTLKKALKKESSSILLHKAVNISIEDFPTQPELFHRGFPNFGQCLAWDAVQKLLVIGTGYGTCKIIGDSTKGNELLLKTSSTGPIRFVELIINKGILVCFFDNIIEIWDIITHTLRGSVISKDSITAVHQFGDEKLILFGTSSGDIHFLNFHSCTISGMKLGLEKFVKDASLVKDPAVVSINTRPLSDHQILIGFENGLIAIWDLNSAKVSKSFLTDDESDRKLTGLAWKPTGKEFISTYDSGEICFWHVKKQDSKVPIFPTNGEGPRRSINKVLWIQVKGDDIIALLGGSREVEGDGILILQGKKCTLLTPNLNTKIIDFLFLTNSPWNSSTDNPSSLLFLCEHGLVLLNEVGKHNFPLIQIPPCLIFQDSQITKTALFSDVPDSIISSLSDIGKNIIQYNLESWVLKGGTLSITDIKNQDLIVTCHSNGKIRFWRISPQSISLELLTTLNLGVLVVNIFFDFSRKYLIVATIEGKVFFLEFGNSPQNEGKTKFYSRNQEQTIFEAKNIDGFELWGEIILTAPLQTIHLAPQKWNQLALTDLSGFTGIFDIDRTSNTFLVQSQSITSAKVCCLCFVNVPVANKNEVIPHLFVGLTSGVIHALNLKSNTMEIITENRKPSHLLFLEWIDERGTPSSLENEFLIRRKPVSKHSLPNNTFLLFVSQSEIGVILITETSKPYKKITKVDLPTVAQSAFLIKKGDEFCLCVLDTNGNLNIYTLCDLTLIFHFGKLEYLDPSLKSTLVSSLDGRILNVTPTCELVYSSIFKQEFKQNKLFVVNFETPVKPKKKLEGIFKSKKKNPPNPYASIAEKNQEPENKKEQKSEVRETQNVMNKTKEALIERGEKLHDIADKTNEMNVAAMDFLSKAKELRKQQEKSLW